MSTGCTLWLEYSGHRRALRDFFFEVCKCTHYLVGDTFRQGPPDDIEREHYAIYNDNNLISIRERSFSSSAYRHDVSVWFTFNKVDYWTWKADVVESSVRWMMQSHGDALLDQDGGPLLGRRSNGAIVVSEQVGISKKGGKHKYARQELELIASVLDRNSLRLEQGHLPHI